MVAAMTDRFHDFAALLDRACELHLVPGLAAAVVTGDHIAAIGASGIADLATGEKADPSHISRWYSISKPITALAVLAEASRGRIDLDAPVTRLVPGLAFADPFSHTHASLRDCLLHRTGLLSGNWTWDAASTDPAELLRRLVHQPCPHLLGQGFHYQNQHFVIIREALRLAGIDWSATVSELLAPLGATIITRQADFVSARRFAPHGPNGLTLPERIADPELDGIAAAGGICGDIGSLAAVAGMMAGRGTWKGITAVPRDRWDAATAPVFKNDDGSSSERVNAWAALAGAWTTYRGHRLLAWAGGYRGWTSHVVAVPTLGIGACCLGNRTASAMVEAVCLALIDRAAGLEPIPWVERYAESKKKMRAAGAQRVKERLSRPKAVWPAPPEQLAGTFHHPGYGDLQVIAAGDAATLRYRFVELPLVPRDGGRCSADASIDGGEYCWDLSPVIVAGRATAWRFGPDSSAHPVEFKRVG